MSMPSKGNMFNNPVFWRSKWFNDLRPQLSLFLRANAGFFLIVCTIDVFDSLMKPVNSSQKKMYKCIKRNRFINVAEIKLQLKSNWKKNYENIKWKCYDMVTDNFFNNILHNSSTDGANNYYISNISISMNNTLKIL